MSKITKEQVLENLEEVKRYVAEADNKKEEKVVGIAIESRYGGIKFQSTKTTFKEAVVEGKANLSDADLYGANLSDADLYGADLSNANLRGADLSDANLSNANLRGADLSDADLSNADLSDANLSDADLYGAEMQRVLFYGRGGTKPLKRAQLPAFLAALGFVIED